MRMEVYALILLVLFNASALPFLLELYVKMTSMNASSMIFVKMVARATIHMVISNVSVLCILRVTVVRRLSIHVSMTNVVRAVFVKVSVVQSGSVNASVDMKDSLVKLKIFLICVC